MVMRYHWGLAAGHQYAHVSADDVEAQAQDATGIDLETLPDAEGISVAQADEEFEVMLNAGNDPETLRLELSLEIRDYDNWDESDRSDTAEDRYDDIGSDEELYMSGEEEERSAFITPKCVFAFF